MTFGEVFKLKVSNHTAKLAKTIESLVKIETILNFVENTEYMDTETRLKLEEKVVELLKTVFDPEIPVDVYNLGLVYKIEIDDDANLSIDMTMTAPSCPMADFIVEDARLKLETIEGLKSVNINVVFEPEWDKDMMSEEAKLELGML
jgi:FeS assembly SUF system protein